MFYSDALSVANGRLTIGGADVLSIAGEFGTPVYIMDEGHIRNTCRAFIASLKKHYGDNTACAFASKAFSCAYMYKILKDEGMMTDVVSGGELHTANIAGFDLSKVYFHGNSKTKTEIDLGLKLGVGRFVVDNFEELELLNGCAASQGITADISIRVKPGIEAHTHEFVQTGQEDSKFGVSLASGEAIKLVARALELKNLRPVGINCHIGSQIFETEPFALAGERLFGFINEVREKLEYELDEINLGGGFGIKYVENDAPRTIDDYISILCGAIKNAAQAAGCPLPRLVIEPGRSIVASTGITVYRVSSVKNIPDIRNYALIDGGMGDNPRYILYGSEYEALLPDRPEAAKTTRYTIGGRYCESGDYVIKDIMMPEIKPGDYIAVLATGAYNYAMAMNYNRVPRPPVVMVRDGEIKLAVRRETYEDVASCDIIDW